MKESLKIINSMDMVFKINSDGNKYIGGFKNDLKKWLGIL